MKNKVVENKKKLIQRFKLFKNMGNRKRKSTYAAEILKRENIKNSCLSKECSRIGGKKRKQSFHRIDRII